MMVQVVRDKPFGCGELFNLTVVFAQKTLAAPEENDLREISAMTGESLSQRSPGQCGKLHVPPSISLDQLADDIGKLARDETRVSSQLGDDQAHGIRAG